MTEKENLLKAFHMDHPEWILNHNTAALTIQPWNTIRDRPAGDAYDWYGVHWKDFVVVPGEQPLDDITEWRDKIQFPDLDAIDWEKGAEIDCKGIDREKQALWIRLPVGLFERMHALMNFETALMSFLAEPEETDALLEALTDFRIRCLDKLITYYKPDIISMHDDYGTQKDLFMSPEIWRTFFKKNITRISDYVKSRGVIFSLHCCGKVDRLIGDFVDCGIDSWDSVQPCCDIPAIFAEYGTKISFSPFVGIQSVSGNLGTPETARQEMRWTIDTLAAHGGLIPLTNAPLCSKEMMSAMEQELVEYGRDYYQIHPIV